MPARLSFPALCVVLFLSGCNNTLNPLCGSARPAPLIGSVAPSSVSFSQVEEGVMLTISGNNFVSASEVVISGKALGATVVSSQKLTILLTTGVISGPGTVGVSVLTPSGNSGDVGCTSGGQSSTLMLTVN
ncbi:MAG TPA: IPT/TIG domain-containing protein [Terriglobales bacterium]|nr:IPT/TIG domain-containing protein [Terriglobales bacterium]